LFQETHLINK